MNKIDIVNGALDDAIKYLQQSRVDTNMIRLAYYLITTPEVYQVIKQSQDFVCEKLGNRTREYYCGIEVKLAPPQIYELGQVQEQIGFVTKDEYNGVVEPTYAESRIIDGRIQTTVVEQAPRVMIDVNFDIYGKITLVDEKGNESKKMVKDFQLISLDNKEEKIKKKIIEKFGEI